MLTPDQAAKQLESFHKPKWLKEQLACAQDLPGRLRNLALSLLQRNKKGKELKGYNEQNKARLQAVQQMESLSEKERQRIFEALCPRIAGYLESAWQRTFGLAYEKETGRQLFRAPFLPEATRLQRVTLLHQLGQAINGYDEDIAWLAEWAPHLGQGSAADELGLLFAAAIDQGGPEGDAVFDILCRSARGEHATGCMGRHVTRGLLLAARQDGWELLAELLRADPTQETGGQIILEALDEANPEAFRWMLQQILESNLLTASAVVRTLDVWFGYQWDNVSERVVRGVIETALGFLGNADARREAVAAGDPETAYLALWAVACSNAPQAAQQAAALLDSANVERRFVAVHLLDQLNLALARPYLAEAVDDEDLRVALYALEACQVPQGEPSEELGLFERVERLLLRLPENKQALQPLVWPWQVLVADRCDIVLELAEVLGERPTSRLLAHFPLMKRWTRAQVLGQLGNAAAWDVPTQAFVLAQVGSTDKEVRSAALRALADCKLSPLDALTLEGLLNRSQEDLRDGIATLLLLQNDRGVMASVRRLLSSALQLCRRAGLELMNRLQADKRLMKECRECLESYKATQPQPSPVEQWAADQLDRANNKARKHFKEKDKTAPMP